MAAKLTILAHKIAIQLHLMAERCIFAVLAPGGKSGNFWIHPRTCSAYQQTRPASVSSFIFTVYVRPLLKCLMCNVSKVVSQELFLRIWWTGNILQSVTCALHRALLRHKHVSRCAHKKPSSVQLH